MTRRLDPDERKEQINFRFKAKLVREIKQIPQYNTEVEKILENHVKNRNKNEKRD